MFIGIALSVSRLIKAGAAIASGSFRVTESGDRRITEDGNVRVVE